MPKEITVSDDLGELMKVSYSDGCNTFHPVTNLKMKCGKNGKGEYEVNLTRDDGVGNFIVETETFTVSLK